MLEYTLLTLLVAVAAFVVYVPGGWFSALQQFVKDVLTIITLPIP